MAVSGIFFTHEFLEFAAQRISGKGTLSVYCALLKHMHYASGISFPSYATIQEYSGIKKSQVSRAIKELQELKMVKRWVAPPQGMAQFGRPGYKIINYDGHKINVPDIFINEDEMRQIMENIDEH